MKGRLERSPDLVWRDEPGLREEIEAALEAGEDAGGRGWVILVDGGRMHELNLLAGEIWLLADGTRDARAIAEVLSEQYDAPAEEVAGDVEAFVGDCLARGWLRLRED